MHTFSKASMQEEEHAAKLTQMFPNLIKINMCKTTKYAPQTVEIYVLSCYPREGKVLHYNGQKAAYWKIGRGSSAILDAFTS